jgi:hypothetical protein
MGVTPAGYNIRPQRRADFQLALAFKDSDGAPISLSGKTVLAQVWAKDRAAKLGDFTVAVDDEPNGQVTLTLGHAITTSLPAECYYDVMVVDDSTDFRSYYLEGIVRPSEGYTEPPALAPEE